MPFQYSSHLHPPLGGQQPLPPYHNPHPQSYQQPYQPVPPSGYQPQFYSAPYYVQQTRQEQPDPIRRPQNGNMALGPSHLNHDTQYVLSRQGPMGSSEQAYAAQNYFARANQRPSAMNQADNQANLGSPVNFGHHQSRQQAHHHQVCPLKQFHCLLAFSNKIIDLPRLQIMTLHKEGYCSLLFLQQLPGLGT